MTKETCYVGNESFHAPRSQFPRALAQFTKWPGLTRSCILFRKLKRLKRSEKKMKTIIYLLSDNDIWHRAGTYGQPESRGTRVATSFRS